MRWPLAALWALLAALTAMGLMFWGRAAFQVRTLPERMMEWLLLFVRLDQFEQGIRTFGPRAKVYALYGGVATMFLALVVIGAVALRWRWRPVVVLLLGIALYLVAMGGLMPLTGGGAFGTALLQDALLVNGLYLGVALAYASLLLGGQAVSATTAPGQPVAVPSQQGSRRALMMGLAGSGVSFAVTLRQGLTGHTTAGSNLPLAALPADLPLPAPSPSVAAEPTVHPGLAGVPTVGGAEEAARFLAATSEATGLPTVPPAPPAASATPLPATQAPALQPTQPVATQTAAVLAPAAPPEPTEAALPTAPAPTAPAPTVAPAVAPTEAPSPTADSSPLPVVGPERALERDKDGVLTALARAQGELAALITPNGAHYVVTKNPVADPVVDAEQWRLVLDGEVNRPVQVDYRTLRRLPAVELYRTLECISNFTAMCQLTYFGCDLMSTARWTGARLQDVLALAGGLKPGVVSLQVQGADEYASSVPAALVQDPETVLAYEMNGQPLPRQHGFPVRLLVPGRYGYKSAKWVVGIRALRTDFVDWYGQRNWSRTGVVKTMSRIDTPYNGQQLPPGRHRIAGIAYAGIRGVAAVQFSADGGRSWNPTAFLESALGRDTWVRWTAEFDVAPGQTVQLQCRAIDGAGQVQTDEFRLPQPDGGSGRHTIEVSAAA